MGIEFKFLNLESKLKWKFQLNIVTFLFKQMT